MMGRSAKRQGEPPEKKRTEGEQNEENEGEMRAAAPDSSARGVECFFCFVFFLKERKKRRSKPGCPTAATSGSTRMACTAVYVAPCTSDGCLCNLQECTQKC